MYFEELIAEVYTFGGDIQKFSGDAFFVEWRVTSSQTMVKCVKLAALCTCKLARDFKDYPVEVPNDAGTDKEIIKMNCRFGLGMGGRLACQHLAFLSPIFGFQQ